MDWLLLKQRQFVNMHEGHKWNCPKVQTDELNSDWLMQQTHSAPREEFVSNQTCIFA